MHAARTAIALNASGRIQRAALCCLAADPEAWRHLRGERQVPHTATSLGLSCEQLRRALALRPRFDELAERELARAERRDCRILTRADPAYPGALLDHPLPPPVLYCRGHIPERPAVAMVGSRRMDPYGERVAEHFGRHLAAAGLTVVSGFARGVDATAHRAALAGGGDTVAVLGCGMDVEYPSGSAELATEVAHHGAVLSEFPMGALPKPWHFPIRNRVIAALAEATLVVQAAPRSGSLITAHQAMELGRDVYAVPGPIFDDLARGTNDLIADGALVARSPQDILDGLSIARQQELFPVAAPTPEPAVPASATREPPPNGFPGKVLSVLTPGAPRTAEEIADATEAKVDLVLGALLELELAGWVRREPGPVFVR